MRLLVLVIIIVSPFSLIAQKSFWLSVIDSKEIPKNTKYEQFSDSLLLINSILNKVENWKSTGFVLANFDSIQCIKDTCTAYVYKGERFTLSGISYDSVWAVLPAEDQTFKRAVLSDKKNLNWPKKATLITEYFMNAGYPFCKVHLQNFRIEDKNIVARVIVNKGERVFYDSLVIKGDAKISKNFLYRYFQIKPGMVYQHEKVLLLNSRIKNILFFKATKDSQVKFVNGQAITYLYLNRAPINRFDFLLGVLPNNNPAEGQSRWTISGDLKAEFYNRFGQGEYIFGQYKKLRPENQEIILKYSMPYIYNFGFGLDSDFRLFRNGNEHIDIIFSGGIQYLYKGLNNIKFGYHYKSSRLIDINRALIQSTGRLPGNLDVVYRSGVVSLQILETDYRFNPSKGILLESKLNIGQKQILENSLISSIPGLENAYDNILKPSLQLESEIDFQYFIPVKTYGAVRLRVLGGIRTGTAEIQQNEFFRIGGNATLRGFDEEGIWTDKFVVFSSEFRLFLDRNSFLSLPFVDFGLTSIVVDNQKILDEAIGLGLGINFSTRAGIFNVSFAAGNRLNSGFDFGNMKVHFGYLNLF